MKILWHEKENTPSELISTTGVGAQSKAKAHQGPFYGAGKASKAAQGWGIKT